MEPKTIFKVLKGFGFEETGRTDGEHTVHHMTNPLSGKAFHLMLLTKEPWSLEVPDQAQWGSGPEDSPFLFVIPVGAQPDSLMDFLEHGIPADKHVVLYDPKDEIEYFMKDLWNFIIKMV